VTVPSQPAYLRELRRLARRFGEDAGARNDRLGAIVLACNEACTNVVLHAYGEEAGPLRMRAQRTDGGLTIEVSDVGGGRPPAADERVGGLGLSILERVCDDVELHGPGPGGTCVVMRFALGARR
jgi:anti-sigma regulatory factor (Ser/Thr protein kinase)